PRGSRDASPDSSPARPLRAGRGGARAVRRPDRRAPRGREWGRDYRRLIEHVRWFTSALLAAHGVPQAVLEGGTPFFDSITEQSRPFTTDRQLDDGDLVEAGTRTG